MHRHCSRAAGYSVIETMFVLGVMGVLASIAAVQLNASRPVFIGDGAARVVLGQFNQARETAIAQRRYIRVSLTAPNVVQLVREDTTTTTSTISSALLEGGVSFTLLSGLPDTPDSFGSSSAISFGTITNMKFAPDGTLVNQDGQTINGSVFMAWSNQPRSARAVTVLGSTGRVRGYRWDGRNWKAI
jgi:type II secretory pathway pseudopilin PulG